MDIKAFYDDYVGLQEAEGVNARHRAILGWLRRFGMGQGHRVLEIGCGIGTLTSLIAPELDPKGSLLAVDLSPKSIEIAREALKQFQNTQCIAADIVEVELEGTFDVVVLPDVIEHIPQALHPRLMKQIASWLDPSGFVLMHFPAPGYHRWVHQHHPELLQIIDEVVQVDKLVSMAYEQGLVLDYLETYGIWIAEGEYQVAVFRLDDVEKDYRPREIRRSLMGRVWNRLARLGR